MNLTTAPFKPIVSYPVYGKKFLLRHTFTQFKVFMHRGSYPIWNRIRGPSINKQSNTRKAKGRGIEFTYRLRNHGKHAIES